jgi:CHASE domain
MTSATKRKNLLQRFPTIQAVKWAPRIDFSNRVAFEEAQRADLPGFEIREVDASGQRRRAAERDRYYPVTYVEPLKGNEHIVGFDLFSEPGRRTAIEETINTGRVTATPPIRLVQEKGDQPGILLMPSRAAAMGRRPKPFTNQEDRTRSRYGRSSLNSGRVCSRPSLTISAPTRNIVPLADGGDHRLTAVIGKGSLQSEPPGCEAGRFICEGACRVS